MDKKQKLNESLANTMGVVVILFSFIISYFIYTQILGSPDNFIDGDPDNQPKEGFYLGTIYKGGKIVILQITFMVILLTYSIERALSLFRARGKKSNVSFANTIKENLGVNDLNAALTSCNNQKGAVANVVFKGLNSYMLESPQELRPEEKAYQIKRDLEEATHLEVPDLEKNMIIISTIASVATLVGLLGTVTGMIQAFSALAIAGTPDAVGLAGGISQALITTALGISTSAVAIVIYNFYTTIIDNITYAMDETNYAILNHFKQSVKPSISEPVITEEPNDLEQEGNV
ncbi:MotA/TolQ/ExbB proton channel family protein [Salibacteraceae bacterium]|nr:MotA/TolQ/ExbB proton channel family protein [Salibacteraceae bacterium]MDC1304309.1 MotA/TolQ/ExbB proton channel family protein [Salibacteraceae bacterium]